MAKETVSVSGSTTVLPLAESGAEAFNGEQSDYQVLVTGGGTGVGIKNIAEGNSDIGMASARSHSLRRRANSGQV